MSLMLRPVLVLAAAVAVLLAGCSSNPAAPSASLAGDWRLVELTGQAVPEGEQTPTLNLALDERMVSGMAGCNRFHGQVEHADAQDLRFGPLAATKMACLDGDRMALEQRYLAMLAQVASQRLEASGRELSLLDAGGRILARFHR